MNYTGGPSISGCRPVLSLYPTHHFCQYLLRIFITFTNSSLFTRAFSTNSRRPLSHAAGVTAPGCALSGASRQLPQRGRSSTSPSLLRNATARVAAPSVCFAAARILLAAAPTAPPCFRHWRRSSPLLLVGEALAVRSVSCIFLPKFMVYWFCGSSRPFYGKGGGFYGAFTRNFGVCRSKCNVALHLQVA